MRAWTICKHFWELIGNKGQRRFDGHAMARCRYCHTWTVTDLDDIGPCFHSMGQRQSAVVVSDNIPLEPEYPMADDRLQAIYESVISHSQPCDCEGCRALRGLCTPDCACFLHGEAGHEAGAAGAVVHSPRG